MASRFAAYGKNVLSAFRHSECGHWNLLSKRQSDELQRSWVACARPQVERALECNEFAAKGIGKMTL